jgi:hypothetical protein
MYFSLKSSRIAPIRSQKVQNKTMHVDVRKSLCYISAPMLNAGIPNNAPKQGVMLTNVLPSNSSDKKKPLRT